jgi:catechol-2,3-dioxygenase
VETRGVTDHGFIRSIYFRDPNGYVIELTARTESAEDYAREAERTARDTLANWQRTKPAATG